MGGVKNFGRRRRHLQAAAGIATARAGWRRLALRLDVGVLLVIVAGLRRERIGQPRTSAKLGAGVRKIFALGVEKSQRAFGVLAHDSCSRAGILGGNRPA